MKKYKIIHWIATVLISALLVMSATMYIVKHEEIAKVFTDLGFPVWLMYPMAISKYLAVLMLFTKFNKTLTEWAYAGMFFNLLLALGAHSAVSDDVIAAIVALVLMLTSYFTWKKLEATN